MRKTVTIIAAAVAALTSTIGMAQAPAEQRFTRDGQTYIYTAVAGVGASQVIDGRTLAGGKFHLVVRGDHVTGTADGMPVSFRLADIETRGSGGFGSATR